MPTTKKRINLSLPSTLEQQLKFLANRDEVPEATKAVHLIQMAIEMDEDEVLNKIAEKRDTKDAKFLTHKDAWK